MLTLSTDSSERPQDCRSKTNRHTHIKDVKKERKKTSPWEGTVVAEAPTGVEGKVVEVGTMTEPATTTTTMSEHRSMRRCGSPQQVTRSQPK